MKPRNKFEKAVLAQSKKLRPITPIQINWAFRNCVEHYAHRLPKGRTTCMDCGHSWVMTEQTEHCTCPECGASLKVCLTYQRKVRQKQYFTTLTTSGEYQVLRMFLLVVGMEKGVNAKSYALEIGQYWWNEQGRKAVVALLSEYPGVVYRFENHHIKEVTHEYSRMERSQNETEKGEKTTVAPQETAE